LPHQLLLKIDPVRRFRPSRWLASFVSQEMQRLRFDCEAELPEARRRVAMGRL
jgi:hypothetical protein